MMWLPCVVLVVAGRGRRWGGATLRSLVCSCFLIEPCRVVRVCYLRERWNGSQETRTHFSLALLSVRYLVTRLFTAVKTYGLAAREIGKLFPGKMYSYNLSPARVDQRHMKVGEMSSPHGYITRA
jgi:hypothetical protein